MGEHLVQAGFLGVAAAGSSTLPISLPSKISNIKLAHYFDIDLMLTECNNQHACVNYYIFEQQPPQQRDTASTAWEWTRGVVELDQNGAFNSIVDSFGCGRLLFYMWFFITSTIIRTANRYKYVIIRSTLHTTITVQIHIHTITCTTS